MPTKDIWKSSIELRRNVLLLVEVATYLQHASLDICNNENDEPQL